MGLQPRAVKCEHRVHENGAFNSEQARSDVSDTVFEMAYNEQVMDLLMWKDVTKSGIAFGTATFLYLLFELSGWTTVAILANAALLAIIGTFVWSTVSQVLGKSALPIPEPNPEAVDTLYPSPRARSPRFPSRRPSCATSSLRS